MQRQVRALDPGGGWGGAQNTVFYNGFELGHAECQHGGHQGHELAFALAPAMAQAGFAKR